MRHPGTATTILVIASILIAVAASASIQAPVAGFRPPAVPLLVSDPFFSLWSAGDNLYDTDVTRWTGRKLPMVGMFHLKGHCYRFMGSTESAPDCSQTMKQENVTVAPTETTYVFSAGECLLHVSFLTPQFPHSLEAIAFPYSFVTFKVQCASSVHYSVYFDINAEIVSHDPKAKIYSSVSIGNYETTLFFGKRDQQPLHEAHDELDWGNVHVGFQTKPYDPSNINVNFAPLAESRQLFAQAGALPKASTVQDQDPDLVGRGVALWFKQTASEGTQKVIAIGLEETECISWFNKKLTPYHLQVYGRFVPGMVDALKKYQKWSDAADDFNQGFFTDIGASMGAEAATLLALSYRQVIGATKAAYDDVNHRPYYFMKEISSDGDLSTVDVIYPAAPFFMYYNHTLLLKLLEPVMDYAQGKVPSNYKDTFAPHHVGLYPIGYAIEQEDMPIEETANMVLMLAAYTKLSNDASYWKDNNEEMFIFVETWVKYLIENLPYPGDQLCTDDFLGPSPNNTNLAAKGILAIRAFAWLSLYLEASESDYKYYLNKANTYLEVWTKQSQTDLEGHPHWKLQYNLTDSWSLKYNILFEKYLELDFFPEQDLKNELAYYIEQVAHPYGVPLDSRNTFTKLDWEFWVAAISKDAQQRDAIYQRAYKFAHETPTRVPLTDWYDTVSGKRSGFTARPVVGGLWAPLLHPIAQ